MKMLLYCTKSKPYLIHESGCYDSDDMCCDYNCFSVVDRQELYNQDISLDETYNGKIVGECDFEVEEITYELYGDLDWQHDYLPTTNTMGICNLENASCLDRDEIKNYLKDNKGYAIHIKNLHIFDKPRELNTYSSIKDGYSFKEHSSYNFDYKPVEKAPQNMMNVGLGTTSSALNNKYILISIKPEWLCKILNGEKTIEVRKKVLKEMMR